MTVSPVSFDFRDRTFSLHPQWIRERCICSLCVQEESLQPIVNISAPTTNPDSLFVQKIEQSPSQLTVFFKDDHKTILELETVLNEVDNFHHYGARQTKIDTTLPAPLLWDAETFTMPHYDQNTLMNSNEEKVSLLESLLKYGVAVVDNVPTIESEIVRWSENLVDYVRETSWGVLFEVKATTNAADAKGDADQAFTGGEIEFHVDNPYRDPCIDYQVLHCLESKGLKEGEGLNRFVDALAAAEKLRISNPEAFDILCNTPVKWEHSMPHLKTSPIIELDVDRKTVRRIHYSTKSGGYAPALDIPSLDKFYEAKRLYTSILEDERNVIYHRLQAGQLVMFTNSRVLHARTFFDSTSVSRHLQGLYIDHDAITRAMWLYREAAKEAKVEDSPTWTKLDECSVEDVQLMGKLYTEDAKNNQASRALGLLLSQRGDHLKLGAPVDLFQHGLQCATLAYDAGENIGMVVAALLHDVGELLSATNHGDISAALLAPYVDPSITWMLSHHEIFQMYYYGKQAGIDHNKRDLFKDSPHYELTVRFCEKYDQRAFDASVTPKPIDFFKPMVEEVFARKPYWHTPQHPKCGAVLI